MDKLRRNLMFFKLILDITGIAVLKLQEVKN